MPAAKRRHREVICLGIHIVRLSDFVSAIAAFWVDTTYIYNESIVRKHPGLEARLVEERKTRTWRPAAATDEGR